MTTKPLARLIIVGGFFSAGKTTLVGKAAQKMINQNDVSGAMDTVVFLRGDGAATEGKGSSLSAELNGLIDNIARVGTAEKTKAIIVEAGGNCTDFLSALVPLIKNSYKSDLAIAPVTVLVDPLRFVDIMEGGTAGLPAGAAVDTFLKQLAEANVIVINKNDLNDPADIETLQQLAEKSWPNASVLVINVKTGEGLDAWLDLVS